MANALFRELPEDDEEDEDEKKHDKEEDEDEGEGYSERRPLCVAAFCVKQKSGSQSSVTATVQWPPKIKQISW
jgi:hypothetical protein